MVAAADNITPIIFVLSQGVDPSWQVLKFAEKKDIPISSTSLGQGQQEIATRMIKEGKRAGNWVLLQNCHLFKSWMGKLAALC